MRKISEFQEFIFLWWEKNRRDLPWRRTRDPYQVLVSEVMLQQTQVSRVLPKYEAFLGAFPTVANLANASTADVLRMWKGLGYNRRALYLKRAAEAVEKEYQGTFPQTDTELVHLPGVGIYTARAVCIFAFGQDLAAVDTNIRAIITHYFFADSLQPANVIQDLATRILPKGKSWEWHQALMDYGALAMPEIERGSKTKMNTIGLDKAAKLPFRETRRFFRGRILDALREKSWDKVFLAQYLVDTYGRDEAYFGELFGDLQKEGLIALKKSIVALPE